MLFSLEISFLLAYVMVQFHNNIDKGEGGWSGEYFEKAKDIIREPKANAPLILFSEAGHGILGNLFVFVNLFLAKARPLEVPLTSIFFLFMFKKNTKFGED